MASTVIIRSFELVKVEYDLKPLVAYAIVDHVPVWAAYVIGPLVMMTVCDFFNYWMHRAQHKWFWAQHSIHHAIRDLSAVNCYMHWTEEFFRLAFISIPTAVFFGLDVSATTVVSMMLTSSHGMFIHSASRLHFGKIGRLLLVDNRWHRIHHSIEPAHFDKNFGGSVTLWDRLFGTAHVPENDEWPQTGLRDTPEPASVDDYLWRPFRRPSGHATGTAPDAAK